VEATRFQERSAETVDTVAGAARYRMNVTAHPEGVLVSYDGFVFPPPADTSEASRMGALAERAATLVPKVVIDAAGTFVRVADVATVRARLDSLMVEMLPPEDAAAARETITALITEDALSGLAAQEWNAIVGLWAGADLELGETYEMEEETELPMIPGATVPMVSEFAVERRLACVEGGTTQDCVEIRLVSRPDADAMKGILEQFMARMLATPGLGGIGFESLDMENEVVLVTEPGTLRPHRVRLSKAVTGVVTAAGERGTVSQVEVRTFRYTYGER
jgi:hypothetical protein